MINDLVNNYIDKGYIISERLLNEDQILSLKKELDEEYKAKIETKSMQMLLHDFNNPQLIKKIILLFNSDVIKDVKKKLEKFYKSDIVILPLFEVHKNNHVNLKVAHGWHRDCGIEMNSDYCKNILYKKNYFFSKIGIYLQENTDYGGCIDIIKKSHKNFSKNQVLLRKIKNLPLKLINFINQRLNIFYFMIPEIFFMFLLSGKKLYPKKSAAFIFDSRLTHRSSIIYKNKFKSLNFEGRFKALVPEEFNKYAIYCHFGTSEAVDSYLFKRLNKKENPNLLQIWVNQIETISKYDIKLANQINKVMKPIKKKYKDYL